MRARASPHRAASNDAGFRRDLRPMALSDAKRQRLSLETIRDVARRNSMSPTTGHLRGFEVKEASRGLTLPKPRGAV